MILQKGGGTLPCFIAVPIFFLAFICGIIGPAAADVCTFKLPDCNGPDCFQELDCLNGQCDKEGLCVCSPCYTGRSCNQYVDKYLPEFAVKSDTISISPGPKEGPIYRAAAEDFDLGKTCPERSQLPLVGCPCAVIHYSILDSSKMPSLFFGIDEFSGDVFLEEGAVLRDGDRHELTLVASNISSRVADEKALTFGHDLQKLVVVVRQPDSLNELLDGEQESFQESVKMAGKRYTQGYDDNAYDQGKQAGSLHESDSAMKSLIRTKRDSAGTTAGDSKLTLTETTTPPAELKPGNSIDYQLKVVLPTLSTAMDLVIEIFVMDAVTGITPYALCDPKVTKVGTMIKDEGGAAVDIDALNSKITKLKNTVFDKLYDRAIVDFGKVKNDDTAGDGVTNTDASEIIVTFTAVLINNPSYDNATVIVTAGAEYDSERYVWVSQASHNYLMDPPDTYDASVVMNGPTSLAEWSGGTFIADAHITHPFDDVTFQVYTSSSFHDKFTVSQVAIASSGANWVCMSEDAVTTTYYDSVSGKTAHRATMTSLLILKNLDYTQLAAALVNDDNKISFSFTIFLMDALAGDALQVTASLLIGTTTIWTAPIDISVTAGSWVPAAGNPDSWAFISNISQTTVGDGGTVTWGVEATIPEGANALVKCSITGDADNKVCGINYGKVGSNIAYTPDLSSLVEYNTDGSASFEVNINSTGPGFNTVVFEISVHYPTGSPGTVSVSCDTGFSQDLVATAGTAGITDMSGETSSLVLGADTDWYIGSQAALKIKLKFPVNSATYKSLIMETAGDLEISGWGAKVCKMELVSAGKGVPCVAGQIDAINEAYLLQKAKDDSVFDDSAKLDLLSACGVNRISSSESDMQVEAIVYFELPPGQASAADGSFNISAGVNLDDVLIWTGWDSFNINTGAPAAASANVPIFAFQDSAAQSMGIGTPYVTKFNLKLHPETVGVYTITASSSVATTMSICRIVILGVGSNYPCVDPDPYYKENEPYQVTTIIHDAADWGASAVLNLGTLRNLGTGTMFAENFADSDTINVGVIVRGIAGGAADLNLILDNTGTSTTITQSFTITDDEPNTGTLAGAIAVNGLDGTDVAYEGVMKMIEYTLTIPEGYGQLLKMTVTNTALADISLCVGGVFTAGKNIPCVIPSLTTSNLTADDNSQVLVVDLLQVCYYQQVANASEDTITLQVGVMFLDGGASSATVSAVFTEGTTDLAPVDFAITKTTDPYVPANFSTAEMKLELLDNETTTVTPGQRIKVAVAFTIPKFATVALEGGVMTPSEEGRAYVTVHGFSFRGGGGKNIGCLLSDCMLYNPTVLQNSSFAVPMIHTSQTDTLVVNLKYITNTGMTHLHKNEKPEDDQIFFDADLLIADHSNASSDGLTFSISFAIKAGNMIFVIEKDLLLSRTGNEAIDVGTELEITSPLPHTFNPNDKINLVARLSHVLNESTEEANSAIMRLFLPKYVSFVNDSVIGPLDSWESNIPGVVSSPSYVDFNIQHLFFTDNLEVNFSLTVDPEGLLPKGLGLVNSTVILRLLCVTTNNAAVRYCGNTSYVMYEIFGPDCFDSLGLAAMQDCQLSASSAITADVGPEKAKSGSGSGWSPAVRTGSGWEHYITVDFLKKTRVTKIVFESVTSTRAITKFKMQLSHSGSFFSDACPDVLEVVASETILPLQCRFEARYGRILILEALGSEDESPIGVRFDWFGCPIASADDVCNPTLTTALTDSTSGWRHVAHDSVNAIFYFCDFIPKKKRIQCYSTTDGEKWNAMPSYIGRLVGFDADTEMMYAKDRKERAMVASTDGINWSIVPTADIATIQTRIDGSAGKALPVPGEVQSMLTPVVLADWKADYTGISYLGAHKAKWSNCCS